MAPDWHGATHSSARWRKVAALAWPVLTAIAAKRPGSVITYGQLAPLIGLPHHRLVKHVLSEIQSHCLKAGLPPLSILVVNNNSGRPGAGFVAAQDHPAGFDSVYSYDWRRQANPFLGTRNYWMFICNPKKWEIDKFIRSGRVDDAWKVSSGDVNEIGNGDLALIRVGNDSRSRKQLDGLPKLHPGVYALCMVTSDPRPGDGSASEFDGEEPPPRQPGYKEVGIRYRATFLGNPLLLDKLKHLHPPLQHEAILHAPQASTKKLPAEDFRRVLNLLGIREEELIIDHWGTPSDVTMAQPIGNAASLEAVERFVRVVERGPEGRYVKKHNGYRCQLCEAIGFHPIGFETERGQPYVEAHHAVLVSKLEPGTLHRSYIMTLCANHHRQLHYGKDVAVALEPDFFIVNIGSQIYQLPRCLK
jgi:hypothetical protein